MENILETFLVTQGFAWLLIFCRVGAGLMLLPGFGEAYVLSRARLLFALMLALVLTPLLSPTLPPVPATPIALGLLLVSEILAGAAIGGLSRMLISTLHVTGQIISLSVGLSSAVIFDFNQATQGTLLGNLLSFTAVTIMFATDMHHLMVQSLVESYDLLPAGAPLPSGDFAQLAADTAGKAFLMAIKLSAPFLVVAIAGNLTAGLMSRVMPSMQVFFILIAPQILIGFLMMGALIGTILYWYLHYFSDSLRSLLHI